MLPWIQQHTARQKIITRYLVLFLATFLFFGAAASVRAQGADVLGTTQINDSLLLGGADIRLIIARIIRAVLGLTGIVLVGLILYGGFTIMTSGGAEEKVTSGKKIIINAAIGLAIILSSVGIVQFVIQNLLQATGGLDSPQGGAGSAPFESFSGSGALGHIVKDHYPQRNQTDVKRNTSIFVTFREPIDPASIIDNTNNSCMGKDDPADCDFGAGDVPLFGDCVRPADREMDRARDCDRVKPGAVTILRETPQEEDAELVPVVATAITTYEGEEGQAFTFSFKPLDLLGETLEDIPYTVALTDRILKVDGRTAALARAYTWGFIVGTEIDLTPPYVTGVFPEEGARVPRNTIVQIHFNEPMDPSVVQGMLRPESNFYHLLFTNEQITGEWRISNGYRTVEFVSSEPCGQNSCGDTLFCLPVLNCAPNDATCDQDVGALVRTAEPDNPDTFEALPFSGVMDAQGNALDGNNDGVRNGKPALPGDFKTIDPSEQNPDNFFWKFTIQNSIKRDPPYIRSVSPSIDEQRVSPAAPLTIAFSAPMWLFTLADIFLEEYPANVGGVDDIWYWAKGEANDAGQTVATIEHRIFGPNDQDLYYFTTVPSTLKDVYQNCIYPGRGPQTAGVSCDIVDAIPNANCVPVTVEGQTDSGCIMAGANNNVLLQPNSAACLEILREQSLR